MRNIYLFYDFETISNFPVFINYDLTSLSDFQEIIIVLGVNLFYLIFLCFILYTLFRVFKFIVGWFK